MDLEKQYRRKYLNARNLRAEAIQKINAYEAIMKRMKHDYDGIRQIGIPCKAFIEHTNENAESILVTRHCWQHIFKHPTKRQSKTEKLERALCFPLALKLLEKTTTYQEVSREKDRGGNEYLSFGIIGYVRGNRIKVIIRRQEKRTNAKKVLYSFFQMSSAPVKMQHQKSTPPD